MSEKPISPLRQRMIEDIAVRRFNEKTQSNYIRKAKNFAVFLGCSPDQATTEDPRRYQVHESRSAAADHERHGRGAAVLLHGDLRPARDGASPHPRASTAQAAEVVSQEEVGRLLEAALGPKWKAALDVAYGAGLRVSEVANLKVSDIDSKRMLLPINQGKGKKDRHGMLSPKLLQLLRDWWCVQ